MIVVVAAFKVKAHRRWTGTIDTDLLSADVGVAANRSRGDAWSEERQRSQHAPPSRICEDREAKNLLV